MQAGHFHRDLRAGRVMLHLILVIASLLLFLLAGAEVRMRRVSLGWLGLACLAASMLVR